MGTKRARRRWELSPDELARVDAVRGSAFTPAEVLAALVRSPRLIPSTLRSALAGAADGVRNHDGLCWILDAKRVQRVVPDAGTCVGGYGEDALVELLRARLGDGARALEIGCGGGRVARLVAPLVAELVCSDISDFLLAEARDNLADRPNVRFARTHGFRLPFEDGSFDAVYSHDVFVQFDVNQSIAMLDETRRVLRPEGSAVMSFFTIARPEWARHQLEGVRQAARSGRFGPSLSRSYTSDQVEAFFTTAGLEIAETRYADAPNPGDQQHFIVAATRPR